MSTPFRCGGAVALLLSLEGCSSSTHIFVKSAQQTNDGNTLYMMARNSEGRSVVSERYQEMATKLFADPPDPSVLNVQPIFPGNTVSLNISEAEAKQVVLYFFFTNPGTNWRVPLPRPLPAEIYIDLGEHQIERVQVRKR